MQIFQKIWFDKIPLLTVIQIKRSGGGHIIDCVSIKWNRGEHRFMLHHVVGQENKARFSRRSKVNQINK
jgi:hypothetical protein